MISNFKCQIYDFNNRLTKDNNLTTRLILEIYNLDNNNLELITNIINSKENKERDINIIISNEELNINN